jgi:hypothetical protein
MSHRHFVFGVLPLLLVTCGAGQMQPVRVSADNKGFIVVPSGAKFVPWGHNYAAEGMEDSAKLPFEKIERDFADLKNMGANVARIHSGRSRFRRRCTWIGSTCSARLVRR